MKSLTGRCIHLEVDLNDTIESVKSKIDDKLNIPIKEQRLIYSGLQLENNKTIEDYGIERDALVHLVVRIPG